MTFCQQTFAVVMPSGAHIDLHAPDPKRIWIVDIADALARLSADPYVFSGYYSVAQRGYHIAQAAASRDGPLAGLHGLLCVAPLAVLRIDPMREPKDRPREIHELIGRAVADALDLDYPSRETIAWLEILQLQMRLSELRCLRRGVGREVDSLAERAITPLVGRIAPVAWDIARDRYLDTFKTYATLAGLSRTQAWQGVN